MNMQQDPSRPELAASIPEPATSIPEPPPPPSGSGSGLRSRNRIRAHGVEAIRWIRNSREIQNMFQGRTPFTVAHVDDDGTLELATLDVTRSTVTVRPRQWVVFVDEFTNPSSAADWAFWCRLIIPVSPCICAFWASIPTCNLALA